MTAKKIALFIDADNVSAKFGKQIFDALASRGEIFIRRIYGNWQKSILHGWNENILNFSLRPVQQTDFATGKNATDMSLTIDAMDVLHGGRAEVFALVSNDSDFTPLAIRLREGGMNVIGLGNAKVSNSFRFACNEFIDLENISEVQIVKSIPEVDERRRNTKYPMRNYSKNPDRRLKSPVQMSLFDEDKEVAAQSAPSSKVVPITAPKMSLQERFIMCGQNGLRQPKKKFQQIHNILREAATAHGDAAGFSLLNYAGQAIKNKNLGFGIKDFGYNHLRDFVADFPELYETTQDNTGHHFRYRCR